MVGDSEVDGMSAENAKIPFILVKDGYTEKSTREIKHDELIEDFKNSITPLIGLLPRSIF